MLTMPGHGTTCRFLSRVAEMPPMTIPGKNSEYCGIRKQTSDRSQSLGGYLDTDKTGTFVLLSSVAIGFFAHWVWKHDLFSIIGGILIAMIALNLTPELFYDGDKKCEHKVLLVLQGGQICLLILIAKLEIIPVLWLTVFILGVLRISFICYQELKG
jgi:hypothetical protein